MNRQFWTFLSDSPVAIGHFLTEPSISILHPPNPDCLADQKGLPRDKVQSWTPYMGGAPLNVACSVAKLGVPAAFISALGDDDFGRRILQMLDDRGVNRRGVQIQPDRPTRDIYVVRTEDGDREFAGFGRPTEDYSDAHIHSDALPLDLLSMSRVLVTGTLGLAQSSTREAMERAVFTVKKARGGSRDPPIVLVDVNWRPVFWADPATAKDVIAPFVQLADIVKITDLEAAWLFGVDPDLALKEPAAVLDKLPTAKGVLVTAGEKGAAYAFHPGKGTGSRAIEGFVPVMSVQVVDTTGAGDAFTGGFLAAMLQSGGLETLTEKPTQLSRAVLVAAAAGALTCTGAGAIDAQPTMQDIEALLNFEV